MNYKIDAAHSEITFKVKHLMITNVTGHFNEFDATMVAKNDDMTDATVEFTAKVNSIDTKNKDRDAHLKSDDFFSAEKYPEIKFTSTSIVLNGGEYTLQGNLTIRDVTKPVSLKVQYIGKVVDPWGQTKVGFEAEGKINRKEFGLTWNAMTEAGGVVVSEDVKLDLNVQFIQVAVE